MAASDLITEWFGDGPRRLDDAWLDYMSGQVWHPEISWRAIPGAPDDVGLMEGRERLRRYYGEWQELFDPLAQELTEVVELGPDTAVAVFHAEGTARSGVETTLDYAVHVTLRDGLLLRGREYATRDEATGDG